VIHGVELKDPQLQLAPVVTVIVPLLAAAPTVTLVGLTV